MAWYWLVLAVAGGWLAVSIVTALLLSATLFRGDRR